MGYILYNGKTVTGEGITEATVIINGQRIERIIPGNAPVHDPEGRYKGFETIDLHGKYIMAGGIDAHVHFREPGLSYKADICSESRAAVAGGVTSFIDMPNTKPATTSADALSEKLEMAEGRAYANYGFHLGATNGNLDEIRKIIAGGKQGVSGKDFGGIKIFMGSSTGNMLVDDDNALDALFGIKEKEILVHCEDEGTIRKNLLKAENLYGEEIPFERHCDIRSREACILSSAKALDLAVKHGTRLHLLHISTSEELEMVRSAKKKDSGITAETSANYLWFCDKDYGRLGSLIKCNPSIKTGNDRAALRKALKDGLIDTIGSDHAPHLMEEKERKYLTAPSGIPSIQQSLQVLLTVARAENIPLSRIASVFSEKAADMFGIRDRGYLKEGYFADLAVVDTDTYMEISSEEIAGKCGWSPYTGEKLSGRITDVFVNGRRVIKDSAFTPELPCGQRLVFDK